MIETTEQEMIQLAELMLVEKDAFKAALSLFGGNSMKALFAAQNLPSDPAFIKIMQKVKTEKGKECLPTKNDLSYDIWQKMQSRGLFPDDYVKLAKLYAEINGFIEKAPTVALNNNLTVNKVMIVPKYPNAETWEEKAINQQKNLTDNAATRH